MNLSVIVQEVTSFIKSNDHEGEIIQFTLNKATYELLVKPSQQLVILAGHEKVFKRKVTKMQIGEAWDEREKIFRNLFGSFSTKSNLNLMIELGQTNEKSMKNKITLTLNGPDGKNRQSKTVNILGNIDVELFDMKNFGVEFQPGVWSLEVNYENSLIGRLAFPILLKEDSSFRLIFLSISIE